MGLQISGRTINDVVIIDDDVGSRESFEWVVEDLGLTPVLEEGPLAEISNITQELSADGDKAVICDYRLFGSNYASYDGAELAASLYKVQVPVLLATRWEGDCIVEMRRHRPYIPSLMKPEQVQPDTLRRSVELCVGEFNQDFSEERRGWQTLVRFQYVEQDFVFLIVPAWNSKEGFKLQKVDLPERLADQVMDGYRCHATVNLGAARHEDVYFKNWESK